MNIVIAQFLQKKDTGLPLIPADSGLLGKIFTLVFMIIGALAFFMLVLAGARYVLSQGDPAKVTEAKNQILYAIIGLLIAASALVIVNFVVDRF